jgi:hypothetical protein
MEKLLVPQLLKKSIAFLLSVDPEAIFLRPQ